MPGTILSVNVKAGDSVKSGAVLAILEAMNVRHEMYNRELDYLAREQAAGRALVICPPSTIAIGRLEQNARKMQHVYDQGRKAGEAHLEAIRAFLGESPTTNSNIK